MNKGRAEVVCPRSESVCTVPSFLVKLESYFALSV